MQNLIDEIDTKEIKGTLGSLARRHTNCSDEEERARLLKHIKEVVAMLRLLGVLTIDIKEV